MGVVTAEYIEFTRHEMRVLSTDPSRVMLLVARATPADYRSDVDSIWVLVMRGFAEIAKKISKNASVQLQVRRPKFYVGTFEAGEVVEEADVPDLERLRGTRDNLEKTNVDAKLLVAAAPFRRIIRSAEAYRTEGHWREHFDYVAFNIDNREGKIVFYSDRETYSIIDVKPMLEWLLQIDGHAKVIYKLPSFSSTLLLGLGDTTGLDVRTGGILRVSYTGNYWFLDFWLAGIGTEEIIADLDAILAKPKPVRRLIWRLEGESLKVFLKTLRAVSPFVPADKVYVGCVGDDWWAYWKWSEKWADGYVKMDKYSFQEYVAHPETSAGEFALADVINLLKDADRLDAFWDGEPATSMVLVASGTKTATKERKSEALSPMIIPEIKGESALFSGPADTLRDACEDAIDAKEEFLIFASTPYEITVLGRNNIYYEASLPVDSFKTVEEDFIATRQMEQLKTFFNDIPADIVHVGKSGYDIVLEATIKQIGASVKIRVSQAEEGIRDALKFYEEYRKPPVAPAPTELVKVWILADVPQFVGADMKVYGPYSPGQVREMPRANADTLAAQNLASLLTIEAQLSRAQAQMEQTGTLKPEYLDTQGRLTREGYRMGLTQLSTDSLGFILENPDPLLPDLIEDARQERAQRAPPIEVTTVGSDAVYDELLKEGWTTPILIPRLEEVMAGKRGTGGSSTPELALEMAMRQFNPTSYEYKVIKHYAFESFPYVALVRSKGVVDEITEVSKELRQYDTVGRRPPLELQNRAKTIIQRLLDEAGIGKCERYERPKYNQYWGDKENTVNRLLDTWINGWDIKQSISELKCTSAPLDTAKLADFFLDKLTKAGVQLPAQYKGEFEKAMDINKTYEENLPLIEKAADDIIKRMPAKAPALDVDTVNIQDVFGLDFEKTFQCEYQVNFTHKPTGVELAILKKAGPHAQVIPRKYRVWLLKGLTQMKIDVDTVEEAISRIKAVDIAKEFPEEKKPAVVPERVSRDEFYRAYDEALYEWIPHFIELHKPALAGNLHLEAPAFEAETVAKFSMDTVLSKWASDIAKEKETQFSRYSETTLEHAQRIFADVPDLARNFADGLVRKTYTELLEEAKARVTPTVKLAEDALKELRGL